MLGAFAVAIPIRYQTLLEPAFVSQTAARMGLDPALAATPSGHLMAEEIEILSSMGLSLGFYAIYVIAFEVVLVLVCTTVGAFIFWKRSADWLTWWVSLLLVLLGTNGPWLAVPGLVLIWPAWIWPVAWVGALGMVSNVHLLFLSPDGEFVPSWTRSLAAGFAGGMLAVVLFAGFGVGRLGWLRVLGSIFVSFPVWFTLLAVGVYSQIYRYRRVSGPIERQQTKWVMVSLVGVSLGWGVNSYFLYAISQQTGAPRMVLNLLRPPIVDLFMLLFPIGLGFSILRYRLWDIDVLIRRTLIYGSLTATLAVVYFGSVVLLQQILPAQTQLTTVLSTLTIAGLFSPLRRQIQRDIDRRFYRNQYDSEMILSAFSSTLRSEVDLDRLQDAILGVVDRSLQPASVSLWLRDASVKLPGRGDPELRSGKPT